MKVGLYGLGEVGSAIATLVRAGGHELVICDPGKGSHAYLGSPDFHVVHVCVPAVAVPVCVLATHSRVVLVHSTVPPGTCAGLASSNPDRVFHAPVRGVHPHLARSMQLCLMPVGGSVVESHPGFKAVQEYLISIGISSEYWGMWETTELAKVMCTTRLGLDVLFMRHVAELCWKYGADFDKVYTEWTRAYNRGYQLLDQVVGHDFGKYTRPVLELKEGPIGGHCVVNNARLIHKSSWVANKIVSEGDAPWTIPGA